MTCFLHLFALTINQNLRNLVYLLIVILLSLLLICLFFGFPFLPLKPARWVLIALLQNSTRPLVYVIRKFRISCWSYYYYYSFYLDKHTCTFLAWYYCLKICSYRYQLPFDKPNHTCGGAETWADFMSATELFCSAGFYCPTTVQKIPCDKGYLFFSQKNSSFASPASLGSRMQDVLCCICASFCS